METILATAFGRSISVQKGESSELSKKIEVVISGVTDGQVEGMFVLQSMTVKLMAAHLLLIIIGTHIVK